MKKTIEGTVDIRQGILIDRVHLHEDPEEPRDLLPGAFRPFEKRRVRVTIEDLEETDA